MIRVLGISASPRIGNSYFLLEQAFAAIKESFDDKVSLDLYSMVKKSYAPCDACHAHRKLKGECRIKDDFQELRDKWVKSQAILYCLPVYHMSIPGQLKCFIDRFGSSQGYYYQELQGDEPSYKIPRFLKAIGTIAQGAHHYGGQEKAIAFIIDHALLMRCVPVPGDLSESYVGVGGWTGGKIQKNSMETLLREGDQDAQLTVSAARVLGIRVVEMAMILSEGVRGNRSLLEKEPLYSHKLNEG
jgi:multimeric flavodoxin WrbA